MGAVSCVFVQDVLTTWRPAVTSQPTKLTGPQGLVPDLYCNMFAFPNISLNSIGVTRSAGITRCQCRDVYAERQQDASKSRCLTGEQNIYGANKTKARIMSWYLYVSLPGFESERVRDDSVLFLGLSKIVVNERWNALALNVLWTKISFGGSVKNSWPDRVCRSVSLYVCPSIFGNSARTASPIETGMTPFDASKRRNNDGACHGSIGGTWHMAHAAAGRLAKKIAGPWRSNKGIHRTQTCRSHACCPTKILCGSRVAPCHVTRAKWCQTGMRSRDIFGRLRLRLRLRLRGSIPAPAPAPAPSKTFRRLRLRLQLLAKCAGSGDSGSGSGSDAQVLIWASTSNTIFKNVKYQNMTSYWLDLGVWMLL